MILPYIFTSFVPLLYPLNALLSSLALNRSLVLVAFQTVITKQNPAVLFLLP